MKPNSIPSAGTEDATSTTAYVPTSSPNAAKPHVVGCFSFKSKTKDGRAARIETLVYDDDTVIISKFVVSTEDLTKQRFKLIRQYKWFAIYEERICLLKESLLAVAGGILEGGHLK